VKRFELTDQHRIAAFEEIARAFFADILGMDYAEMLTTDESALNDFAFCGETCSDFPQELEDARLFSKEAYDLWNKWVCRKISDRYGINIADARIYLVVLFRQITSAKEPMVQ
jgi:hypothetical protein